jgi:polysaccharide pyruvyl transferase WcaK-like protein
VLPLAMNKPVVGLSYNLKTAEVMELMGQSAYCLDIDQCETNEVIERFQTLVANGDVIRAELSRRTAECRARLAEQYDRVLGLSAAGA